jgi:hypothetical protein
VSAYLPRTGRRALVELNFNDALAGLEQLREGIEQIGFTEREAARLAVNHTLDWVYTRVVRLVSLETGMQQKYVRSALRKAPARTAADPVARIIAKGGYESLKAFHPRQTKKGVVASPWNKRRLFPHTFMLPNGHVFKHAKGDGHKLIKLWGPAIPKTMVESKETEKLVDLAMATQFPVHYQFFYDRAVEDAKRSHGL